MFLLRNLLPGEPDVELYELGQEVENCALVLLPDAEAAGFGADEVAVCSVFRANAHNEYSLHFTSLKYLVEDGAHILYLAEGISGLDIFTHQGADVVHNLLHIRIADGVHDAFFAGVIEVGDAQFIQQACGYGAKLLH